MIDYLIYEESGRIVQIGNIPDDMLHLQWTDGKTVIPGKADLDKDYVVDGRVVQRPAQGTELVGSTLTGLPQPCTILINDKLYVCEDVDAEFDFTYPGKYRIRVQAFPYLDAAFTIEKS